MNDLFVTFGIESWKGTLEALVMPPVPFLLLVLVGARLMFRNRLLAWGLVLAGCLGVWLSATWITADALANTLLPPARAISRSELAEIRRAPDTAIVVLGGGRLALAPEYGVSDLNTVSLERLRYGLWLARETSLPVAFSGGIGHGGDPGPSEAEIAARVAERDFRTRLRWTETASRDTTENARRTLTLLHEDGIRRVVLVTHALHMPRAVDAFERATQRTGLALQVLPAPMALPTSGPLQLGDWLPNAGAFARTRYVLHEWLGRLMGA